MRRYLNAEYHPSFISSTESEELQTLLAPHFKSSSRRSNITIGNEGFSYTVTFRDNTVVRHAIPWDTFPAVQQLKERLEELYSTTFTYCVVQYYPSGKVGIKPHRDRELTPGTIIAGVSLGATRDLVMSRGAASITYTLIDGSLYVLHPPTNDYWSHSIPTDNTTEPRYSLTFRDL